MPTWRLVLTVAAALALVTTGRDAQAADTTSLDGYVAEVLASNEMALLERNYLDKHAAVNHTARALTEHGLTFVAARHLHHERVAEAALA